MILQLLPSTFSTEAVITSHNAVRILQHSTAEVTSQNASNSLYTGPHALQALFCVQHGNVADSKLHIHNQCRENRTKQLSPTKTTLQMFLSKTTLFYNKYQPPPTTPNRENGHKLSVPPTQFLSTCEFFFLAGNLNSLIGWFFSQKLIGYQVSFVIHLSHIIG